MLYAYCIGVPSSRRIEKRLEEDIAFLVLAANNTPDFRREHLEALAGLFLQVLKLCRKAGLVKLGHVSLDGTKVKANASKHKAMSYGRMKEEEAHLESEVTELLRKALEAEAREEARRAETEGKGLPGVPEEKAQRNFTDPASRIMPAPGGKEFMQAYNAQIAVDSQRQVIVGRRGHQRARG